MILLYWVVKKPQTEDGKVDIFAGNHKIFSNIPLDIATNLVDTRAAYIRELVRFAGYVPLGVELRTLTS